MTARGLPGLVAAVALLAAAAPAAAVPPRPIPEGPDAAALPKFSGRPAVPQPVSVPDAPRHPFMAPNGRSNLHVDGYQTDVHQGPGPLGRQIETRSTFLEGVCASVTFDSRGRIETVCVGLDGPKLLLLEPRTLETLAVLPLPPRTPGAGNVFTDFAGGGYFYLDQRDRAVIPTTTRHVFVVRQTRGGTGFEVEHDYDLTAAVLPGDKIISALPDWSGRLWFASTKGVVGTIDPASGTVRSRPLGEGIANSFAVENTGAVYIVTDNAMYRLEAGATGIPQTVWRETYENSGVQKPGQSSAGSGTTPTLMGSDLVAITDNADPMNVLVYRRGRTVAGPRLVCRQPVFDKGASATDQSLIGTGRSIVAENNYGYSGPAATEQGKTTSPGLERIDLDAGGGCHRVWHSAERAPSVVPKLSAADGLVYTYTKDPQPSNPSADAWYLTALDFRSGRTVYKSLGGEGLGHNNNYAPVTLGPDGTAYVGVLGGLISLRDRVPPPGAHVPAGETGGRKGLRRLRLHVRRLRGGRRARVRVMGGGTRLVRRVDFYRGKRRVARDRRRPFRRVVRVGRGRVRMRARILLLDGRRVTRTRRVARVRHR
ncbi:MAG: hypothetical protein QOE53_2981 [Pseudonocardiales bacterium]|nr:hypothetical protein [Pseudonocardiales bacterium]